MRIVFAYNLTGESILGPDNWEIRRLYRLVPIVLFVGLNWMPPALQHHRIFLVNTYTFEISTNMTKTLGYILLLLAIIIY